MPFLDLKLDLGLSLKKRREEVQWTAKQKKILLDKSNKIIISGGYGSGKTLIGVYKFLINLKKTQGRGIMTGFSFNTIKKLIFQTMEELDVDFSFNMNNSEIKSEYGCFYLYGMDTVRSKARIRSLNLSCWYADEITLQDEEACLEVMARLRSVVDPFWIWATNPDSPHHWVYQFLDKVGISHYSFKTQDNPHLPVRYVEELNLPKNSSMYRQRVLGEWVVNDDSPFANIEFAQATTYDYAFIDPSLSGSDFTAVGLFKKIDTVWICLGYTFKESWHLLIDRIAFILKENKVQKLLIESNLTGDTAYPLFKERGLSAYPYRVSSNKQKRISTLAGRVAGKTLMLDPRSDAEFVKQVINWSFMTKDHDDAPDVMAIFFEFFYGSP